MPNNRIFFRKLEGCASKVYSMSGQKQKSERKSEGITNADARSLTQGTQRRGRTDSASEALQKRRQESALCNITTQSR